MSKFKAGQRVVLVNINRTVDGKRKYTHSKSNTVGNRGRVIRHKDSGWYDVKWDCGHINSYQHHNLMYEEMENV